MVELDQRSHRRECQRVEQGAPTVVGHVLVDRVDDSGGETGGQVTGKGCAGLRRPARHPQRTDHAPGLYQRRDLFGPGGLLCLYPAVERVAQLPGERTGLLVVGGGVAGDDDRSQITQIDLVGLGHGGLGTVSPLRGAQLLLELFGQTDQRSGLHLGASLGLVGLVLFLDRSANGREATGDQLVGDGSLLVGESGQHRVAMRLAGAKPFGLGTGRHLRGRRTVRAIATPSAAWALAVASALAPGAPTVAVTASAPAALVPVASAATALGCQLGGDQVGGILGDQLQTLWLLAIALGGSDRQHVDAVDREVGVGLQLIADLRALGQQRRRRFALWLLGAGDPPGKAFVAQAGDLDVESA